MPSPSNPYIIEKPVTGAQFYGRESVVQSVEHILRPPSRTSVIIFGQRKIGKTSFLLHLTEALGPPFFPVYVDLAGRASQPLAQVLYQMATAAAEKAGLESPPLAAFLHNPDFFQQEFLPALYHELDEQVQPTFLMDEFESVDTPASQLPDDAAGRLLSDYLQKLLTSGNPLSLVFTAGRRMNELGGVGRTGPYARLYQYLSMLTPPQARRLILNPDAPAYESSALHRVIDLTRGHPYLIQALCHSIFEATKERYPDKITVRDVKTGAERLLNRHDSGLFLIWESIPPAEQLVLAAAAERIITPNSGLSEAALEQALDSADISAAPHELQQAVQNLVNWQMLEQSTNGYNFFMDLFRRWVSRHRPLAQVKASALPQFDPQLHELYLAAYQAYTAGDTDRAFNKIIQILAIAPGFVQGHLLLGKIHSNNRRSAQAVKSYEAAYRYNPTAAAGPLVAALVSLGIQQEQRHDLDGALGSYRRVLEIAPTNNAARTRYEALTADAVQPNATPRRSSSRPAKVKPAKAQPASKTPGPTSAPVKGTKPSSRPTAPTPSRRPRNTARWWPILVGVALILLLLYGLYGVLPSQTSPRDSTDMVAGDISAPTVPIAAVTSPVAGAEASIRPDDTTAPDPVATSPSPTADLTVPITSPPIAGRVAATSSAETDLAAGFVAPTATPRPPTDDAPSVVTPPSPPVEPSQTAGVSVTGPAELLPLFTALAQTFGSQTPDFEIKYSTRKSTDSLAAVHQKTADVAFVSRRLSAFELTQMAQVADVLPIPLAEPIRVVAHPQLSITDLTPHQLREIFSGAVTNWRDVGGPDVPIRLVIPAESSDTGRVFQQQILGAQPLLLGENTMIAKTDAEVDRLVGGQPYTIGITADQPQTDPSLAPVQTLLIDNVAPTFENVASGTYPVSRPIYVVTSNKLGPKARAWVDFLFSPEGERIVERVFRDDP